MEKVTVVRQRSYLRSGSAGRRARGRYVLLASTMALLLAVTGATVLLTASAPPPLAQLTYVPILAAALLLGLPGALLAAVVASVVLATMSMPAFFALRSPSEWMLHVALFIVVAAVTGGLLQAYRRRLGTMARQSEDVSTTYTRVLSSLAQIVEGRDERAKGHCERVAHNAVLLGRQLGFKGTQLQTLYWGALLHDLGKIAIPERILLKPTGLSEAEFAEIKLHPQYGADLLEAMTGGFTDIATVVCHHHERWDGTGYPHGLAGEDIPLMSRIVTIMDVFEALTSERPYRKPIPASEALNYVRAETGRHFDPQLVDAFEDLYRRRLLGVAGHLSPVDSTVTFVEGVRVTQTEYSFN